MEWKWPTKSCWMRIITTLIGMSVVDVQRWDRNMRSNYNENSAAGKIEEDFSIFDMVNLIATPLRTGSLKNRERRNQPSDRRHLVIQTHHFNVSLTKTERIIREMLKTKHVCGKGAVLCAESTTRRLRILSGCAQNVECRCVILIAIKVMTVQAAWKNTSHLQISTLGVV